MTVRTEWRNEARNPRPEYIAAIAAELMDTHTVVAVADLAPGQEWIVGELPPAHHYFLFGELAVRELLALVRDADLVVGGVGWIVPAGLALKVKTFIVLGGHGGHNAPAKITDPRLDLVAAGLCNTRKVLPMLEHAAQLRQDDRRPAWAVPSLVAQFSSRRLTWWPELGIGYYPVEAGIAPYDQDYFDHFERNGRSELGRALMQARFDFVERHHKGRLVDVGIGSGAFIELRRRRKRTTWGYDVNPAGIRWLEERALLVDPYLVSFEAMSLWDVLEHIPDFQSLLANVSEWLFLSLPIFRDAEHALRSKHFKPAGTLLVFHPRRVGVRNEGLRLCSGIGKQNGNRTWAARISEPLHSNGRSDDASTTARCSMIRSMPSSALRPR